MLARVITLLVAAFASLALLLQTAPAADALPVAPAVPVAVEGVSQPCVSRHVWPKQASMKQVRAQLSANTGVRLTGDMWDDPQYRPVVRLIWQGLEAVSCTDFLTTVKERSHGAFTLNAVRKASWAWGDWGNTKSNAVTLDFAKLSTAVDDDPGRVVRVLIHEIAHAWTAYAPANGASGYASLYATYGMFSNYGGSSRETFSEVVGYYVARCADNNPYNGTQPSASDAEASAYYRFVRSHVFGGVEFGPEAGDRVNCSLTPKVAKRTQAAPATASSDTLPFLG